MSDAPVTGRLRRLGWVAAALLLVLAAVLLAPFLLTTQLVRLALERSFPDSSPHVGRATLGVSGTLVLHDLVLHDTGALAHQPLLSVHEVDATFGWTELISRRIRRVRAEGVVVHAGANATSLLALRNLISARPGSPVASPWRIDALDVRGTGHPETAAGIAPTDVAWPLRLRMTTSGDRADPTRRLRLVVGQHRRAAREQRRRDRAWAALCMPHSACARKSRSDRRRAVPASCFIALQRGRRPSRSTPRYFVSTCPRFPPSWRAASRPGVANLWASGRLEGPANGRRLAGSLALAGLRVRAPGGSRATSSLEDLTVAARIDTPLPPGPGTAVTIERLRARDTKASVEADALRLYVPGLPAESAWPHRCRPRSAGRVRSDRLAERRGDGIQWHDPGPGSERARTRRRRACARPGSTHGVGRRRDAARSLGAQQQSRCATA